MEGHYSAIPCNPAQAEREARADRLARAYQIPLLPSEVTVPRHLPNDHLNSVQASTEIAMGFGYTWLGWWGALLLGFYDGRITPPGFRVSSVTLCQLRSGSTGVFVNARAADGRETRVSVTDWGREKALRAFQWHCRNGTLPWKPNFMYSVSP